MKLKLKVIILSLITSASLNTAFADNPQQVDGTVDISGEIVNQTCKVAGESTIKVVLPKASNTTLNAIGKIAGLTPFNISLTGCTPAVTTTDSESVALSSVGIYFSSFNVSDDGTLKNIAPNGAENVNVQLLDQNKRIIKLNEDSTNQVKYTQKLPKTEKDKITFNYYAQYYSTGETTAGPVSATVPFVIVYN